MTTHQWIAIIAALIGGGAMGAIITAVFTAFRNRIQPVGNRVEITPVFQHSIDGSEIVSSVTITDNGTDFKFKTLYIAEINLVNKGNKDLEYFTFGVTLAEDDWAILAVGKSSDRHHQVQSADSPSPAFPRNTIDFTVRPFNRADTYTINLYIVAPAGKEPGQFKLSSAEPVKFVDAPSISELLGRVTAELVIGGLKISILR
jgi:hypothetical protein